MHYKKIVGFNAATSKNYQQNLRKKMCTIKKKLTGKLHIIIGYQQQTQQIEKQTYFG